MAKCKYDYYIVKIPGDLEANIEDMAHHAITAAEERTKLYCMPALWTATVISGEIGDNTITFRVTRKRVA